MTTAQRVLLDTRALLSKRVSWAKDARAYDLRNNVVSPTSPYAVRWSLLGALQRATENAAERSYAEARNRLVDALASADSRTTLQRFNEMATHEELLSFLDGASAASVERVEQPV